MAKSKDFTDEREIRRRLALLALTGEQPAESMGPCPDQESFARFLESEPTAPEHQEILRHISLCESCRQRWIELSRELMHPGQRGPDVRSVFKRGRLLAAIGSVGAVAVGVMLFLSIDYQTTSQKGFDAGRLSSPSIENPAPDELKVQDRGITLEDKDSAIITQSPDKKMYSSLQSAEPEDRKKQTGASQVVGEGAPSLSESLQGASAPPVDSAARPEREKPAAQGQAGSRDAQPAATAPAPLADQAVEQGSVYREFFDDVSAICEHSDEAQAMRALPALLAQGTALLRSGSGADTGQRIQVEQIVNILAREAGQPTIDRGLLCERLASHLPGGGQKQAAGQGQ